MVCPKTLRIFRVIASNRKHNLIYNWGLDLLVQIKCWKKIRERNRSLEIRENFLFQDSAPGLLLGELSLIHLCIPSTYCQTVCICYMKGPVHALVTFISTMTMLTIQPSFSSSNYFAEISLTRTVSWYELSWSPRPLSLCFYLDRSLGPISK